MINKIYIVTVGSYSDYQIYKCFINKEDAEDYAEKVEGTVEEHNLHEDKIEMRQYWSGSITMAGSINLYNYDQFEEASAVKRSEMNLIDSYWKLSEEEINFSYRPRTYNINIAYAISYVSKEHCNKLLVEVWQKWLRRFC